MSEDRVPKVSWYHTALRDIILSQFMCRTKMAIEVSQPSQITKTPKPLRTPQRSYQPSLSPPSSDHFHSTSSNHLASNSSSYNSGIGDTWQTTAAAEAAASTVVALRSSLPSPPQIYTLPEILSATNNFLSKPYFSSSSFSSWRCSLRDQDTLLSRKKNRLPHPQQQISPEKLSAICRSHHISVLRLLGAAVYSGTFYLAHEFANGVTLATCLRNPRNPNFTILATWLSRMKVAVDVADGLDYIHNGIGLVGAVHNHIDSGNVVIVEPSIAAKICHFGTAEICGEGVKSGEINGVIGYMAPEVITDSGGSQASDVYAFGVLMLELLSGKEPVTVRYDAGAGCLTQSTLLEKARDAVDGGEGGLRRWVDGRMRDSFPVDVAERVVRLALVCTERDPDNRPDMRVVAGRVSKLYLKSRVWVDKVKIPTEISVSMLAPR